MNTNDLHDRKLCEEGLLDFAVCAAADLSGSCHTSHRGEAEGRPVTQDCKSGIQFLYSGRIEHHILKSSQLVYSLSDCTKVLHRDLPVQGRRAATTSGISW
jgi:hypothetical protein